jgi:hypothetical protein
MSNKQTSRGSEPSQPVIASLTALLVGLTVVGGLSLALSLVAHPAQAAKPGGATTDAPASATTTTTPPDVDYFPSHYVNQATTIEEPVAAF